MKAEHLLISLRLQTTRHQETHELSKEVHRIGFHFPTVVVDEVCAHYGVNLSANGTLLKEEDRTTFQRTRQNKNRNPEQAKDQITINTEARDAIKDLFPNIPDNDLHQIIKTAFQKGQKKVGTAAELPLIRRAQLSVVAHVRHCYTKYDSLLRKVPWNEARNMVESPTLRKLVEWRGDDDTGNDALEEVLREVVVISDEEESDDDLNEVRCQLREASIELITSSINHQQVEIMPIDYAQKGPTNGRAPHDTSDDEAPAGYRYVPQIERRRALVNETREPRRANRYDAWQRAREQYRANPGYVDEYGLPEQHLSTNQIPVQPSQSHAGNPFRSPEIHYERPYQARNMVGTQPLQVRLLLSQYSYGCIAFV